MKIFLNILFCISILSWLFSACEEKILTEPFEFEKEQDFKYNLDYHSNDSLLQFHISEILDSRCPKDVVCVWQGEAKIWIVTYLPEPDTMVLSTSDNPKDTTGNFSFELIEVQPYPVSTKKIQKDEYTVTLRINSIL